MHLADRAVLYSLVNSIKLRKHRTHPRAARFRKDVFEPVKTFEHTTHQKVSKAGLTVKRYF